MLDSFFFINFTFVVLYVFFPFHFGGHFRIYKDLNKITPRKTITTRKLKDEIK